MRCRLYGVRNTEYGVTVDGHVVQSLEKPRRMDGPTVLRPTTGNTGCRGGAVRKGKRAGLRAQGRRVHRPAQPSRRGGQSAPGLSLTRTATGRPSQQGKQDGQQRTASQRSIAARSTTVERFAPVLAAFQTSCRRVLARRPFPVRRWANQHGGRRQDAQSPQPGFYSWA
ncbi:hypothetical protein VTN02DRAFT_5985 [Thermoascus thermophilus]